jgi:xanthine dehydrogenase accessory factor
MSIPEVFAAAQRLQASGTPYALVSVVRAQAPASARPGDKAVVTADGRIDGWVGGGCAQPAVLRTVRTALQDGRARMIRIAPSAEGEERDLGDVLEFGMACHSGGTLELFIDPVLPQARLLVIGDSPVARALAGLAPRVGFAVAVAAQGATAEAFPDARPLLASDDAAALAAAIVPGAFVVVATQGRRDVQGLRAALAVGARQISFVASERKASVLKQSLVAAGSDAAAVAAIRAPAGYPIAAETPEEIALSVLAAVVAARRQAVAPAPIEAAQIDAAPAAEPATLPASLAPAASTVPPAPLVLEPMVRGACCGGS